MKYDIPRSLPPKTSLLDFSAFGLSDFVSSFQLSQAAAPKLAIIYKSLVSIELIFVLPIHLLQRIEQLPSFLCIKVLLTLFLNMLHHFLHWLFVFLDTSFVQQILKLHILLNRRQHLSIIVSCYPFLFVCLTLPVLMLYALRSDVAWVI